MNKLSIFLLLLFLSCNIMPGADNRFSDTNTYKLHLNPIIGSQYYYDIQNESDMEMEVDGKKMDSHNKSDIGLHYNVNKDTSNDLLFQIVFDKLHIYLKNGDNETDADAANAYMSLNPIERMLGDMKMAHITARMSSKGEVKQMNGYKELRDKLLAGFVSNDTYSKSIAQNQWDQLLGEGMIKNNMDQLFKIFPDSAVHLGDKWKLNSKQSGEFPLNVTSFFKLDDINDGVVTIKTKGELISDSTISNFMGNQVMADLKGKQEGEYKMDIKTGMLISSTIKSEIEGNVTMMGREIPVTVENTIKISRRKNK